MSRETETACELITKKYHNESWFVKVDTYGIKTVAIYYKDNKTAPGVFGKVNKFRHFAGCWVRWLKVA